MNWESRANRSQKSEPYLKHVRAEEITAGLRTRSSALKGWFKAGFEKMGSEHVKSSAPRVAEDAMGAAAKSWAYTWSKGRGGSSPRRTQSDFEAHCIS
jgi:hypothetical protein